MTESTKYNFEIGEYTTKTIFDDPDWTFIVIGKKDEEDPVAIISSTQEIINPSIIQPKYKPFIIIENMDEGHTKRAPIKISIDPMGDITPEEFINHCISKLPELFRLIEEADNPIDYATIRSELIQSIDAIISEEAPVNPKKGEMMKAAIIKAVSAIKASDTEFLSDTAMAIVMTLDDKVAG